jgi:hypothetical protein
VEFWNKSILSGKDGDDSIESVALIDHLELFKNGNKVCWSFQFWKTMCHLGLIANMSSHISISALSCWDIARLLSL